MKGKRRINCQLEEDLSRVRRTSKADDVERHALQPSEHVYAGLAALVQGVRQPYVTQLHICRPLSGKKSELYSRTSIDLSRKISVSSRVWEAPNAGL